MESIVSNVSDPSWWFTGVFFVLFGFFLKWFSSNFPKALKRFARGVVYKRRLSVKRERFNQSIVNYRIARANSLFIVFVTICCFYSAWLVSGSLLGIAKQSPFIAVFLALPVYVSEVLWLLSDSHAKDLAIARGRIA